MASGFMNAGLGFASTTGAFIKGAAQAGNQQLADEERQARQDDLMQQVWANKTDNAAKQYEQSKKEYDALHAFHNIISTVPGSNPYIADQLTHLARDPKQREDMLKNLNDTQALVVAMSKGNIPKDYTSTFDQDLQNEATSGLNRVNSIAGRVTNPKYQGWADTPTPWNTPNQSSSIPGAPQPVSQGPSIAAPGAPASTQPMPQPPPLPDNGLSAPVDANGNPRPNTQVAQNDLNNPWGLPPKKPMTPYEEQRLGIERDRLDFQKQTKPATPEEAADIKLREENAKNYLTAKTNGLQDRYSNLQALNSQSWDLNSMQNILDRGFKAGTAQEFYNDMNRFTVSTMGVSLEQMGIPIANSTGDVTLLRKDVANGIINQLKTMHFGRILQYEAQLVSKGFASETSDPNTNIQIVLALQAANKLSMQQVQQEYAAVHGTAGKGLLDRAEKGQQVAKTFAEQHLNDALPWQQINMGPSTLPQIHSLQPGSWFQDSAPKADGKMFKVISSDKNSTKLQDAFGQTYTVGAQ